MYQASGIGVRIGGKSIIDGVDLTIAPGRVVAVIGPNGAGKSTLLRTMAGERRPTTGVVHIHGHDVAALKPSALAAWRAILAQSITLSSPFNVDQVVRLGVPVLVREAAADALVSRALAAVDLDDMATWPITHLSGGEQQRVHAARVLVQLWAQPEDGRARYLLLDEPTSHLDPSHQQVVMGLAREHARNGGGVLAVLHDLNLAAAIADEVAILHRGVIVAYGPPAYVLTEHLLRDVYGVDFHVARGVEGLSVMTDFRSLHQSA
jgi:iron complex transport system ATP-binding protein